MTTMIERLKDWKVKRLADMKTTMHYRLRPIKEVQFGFAHFVSHCIRVQIFQVDFPIRIQIFQIELPHILYL